MSQFKSEWNTINKALNTDFKSSSVHAYRLYKRDLFVVFKAKPSQRPHIYVYPSDFLDEKTFLKRASSSVGKAVAKVKRQAGDNFYTMSVEDALERHPGLLDSIPTRKPKRIPTSIKAIVPSMEISSWL